MNQVSIYWLKQAACNFTNFNLFYEIELKICSKFFSLPEQFFNGISPAEMQGCEFLFCRANILSDSLDVGFMR